MSKWKTRHAMNFIGEQFAIWNALAWGGGEPSCADAYI